MVRVFFLFLHFVSKPAHDEMVSFHTACFVLNTIELEPGRAAKGDQRPGPVLDERKFNLEVQ